MRRYLPLLYLVLSLGLFLLASVSLGQQKIGNPSCTPDPDGSCVFFGLPGRPLPRRVYAKSGLPKGVCMQG